MEMKTKLAVLVLPFSLMACKESKQSTALSSDPLDRKARNQVVEAPWTHTSPQEHISVRELEENAKLEIITETTADRESKMIEAKVLALVAAEDFVTLDVFAADFLKTKERDDDGGWKLVDFYNALDLEDEVPTEKWEERFALLERWIEARPDSQVARIALANLYVSYAWRARTGNWAEKVTDEGWQLMGERLEKAYMALDGAMQKFAITDPMFFQVAVNILLGTGGEKEDFDALVLGSLEIAPDYWGTLGKRAHSLLPRWHGELGDWEAFAKLIAENNVPYGKEQYALIVFQRHAAFPETVSLDRLDWKLLKESIRELLKNYPDSPRNISRAAFIATLADDKAFAKECFDLLGDRCVPDVWLVNGRMCHYRNWAYTGKW